MSNRVKIELFIVIGIISCGIYSMRPQATTLILCVGVCAALGLIVSLLLKLLDKWQNEKRGRQTVE